MTLSERLRAARLRAGLTGWALDVKAGLARGHSALIETGKRQNISIGTVLRLAKALDVPASELLPDEDPIQKTGTDE